MARDLAAEREPELDRPLDRLSVRHRQRTGEREAHRACLRVLAGTEPERAAAEHLRLRLQVDVNLQSDHRLPVHRSRSGTVSNPIACSTAWPMRKRPFSPNCGPMS